jgi:hypothetical protein
MFPVFLSLSISLSRCFSSHTTQFQLLFSQDTADCAVTESAPAEVEQIKSNDNVKCEPEVLIKVEDVSNIVNMPEGEESDTDTETDSESESESDSDNNTDAEDSHHGSLSALAEPDGHVENESTVVVLGSGGTEASTSQFEKYVGIFYYSDE